MFFYDARYSWAKNVKNNSQYCKKIIFIAYHHIYGCSKPNACNSCKIENFLEFRSEISAKFIEYDACPMKGFDYDKVVEAIHLPDDHMLSTTVVVEKKAKGSSPSVE